MLPDKFRLVPQHAYSIIVGFRKTSRACLPLSCLLLLIACTTWQIFNCGVPPPRAGGGHAATAVQAAFGWYYAVFAEAVFLPGRLDARLRWAYRLLKVVVR